MQETVHTAATAPDREGLRLEIEATRAAFERLTSEVAPEVWNARAPEGKWTNGEHFFHVTWALEQLPKEVASAVRGKGMFNIAKWIADPGSYLLIRWESRRETPKSVAARYNAAADRVLQTLAGVASEEWSRGANFYGEGFYTVSDLFHTPRTHFDEHLLRLERGAS